MFIIVQAFKLSSFREWLSSGFGSFRSNSNSHSGSGYAYKQLEVAFCWLCVCYWNKEKRVWDSEREGWFWNWNLRALRAKNLWGESRILGSGGAKRNKEHTFKGSDLPFVLLFLTFVCSSPLHHSNPSDHHVQLSNKPPSFHKNSISISTK